MYVELQQMEERVVYEVNRAVDVLLDAEEEFEWSAGFVACWERDVGELACCGVCYVFASIAVTSLSDDVGLVCKKCYVHGSV